MDTKKKCSLGTIFFSLIALLMVYAPMVAEKAEEMVIIPGARGMNLWAYTVGQLTNGGPFNLFAWGMLALVAGLAVCGVCCFLDIGRQVFGVLAVVFGVLVTLLAPLCWVVIPVFNALDLTLETQNRIFYGMWEYCTVGWGMIVMSVSCFLATICSIVIAKR